MNVNEMFPRKYATGADLSGPVTLTIATVKPEKMRAGQGKPEETKFVVYFQNAKKGVILSRILAGQIAQACDSDETNEWTGKAVTLYPEPMVVAGVPRVAIRARAAVNGTNGSGG